MTRRGGEAVFNFAYQWRESDTPLVSESEWGLEQSCSAIVPAHLLDTHYPPSVVGEVLGYPQKGVGRALVRFPRGTLLLDQQTLRQHCGTTTVTADVDSAETRLANQPKAGQRRAGVSNIDGVVAGQKVDYFTRTMHLAGTQEGVCARIQRWPDVTLALPFLDVLLLMLAFGAYRFSFGVFIRSLDDDVFLYIMAGCIDVMLCSLMRLCWLVVASLPIYHSDSPIARDNVIAQRWFYHEESGNHSRTIAIALIFSLLAVVFAAVSFGLAVAIFSGYLADNRSGQSGSDDSDDSDDSEWPEWSNVGWAISAKCLNLCVSSLSIYVYFFAPELRRANSLFSKYVQSIKGVQLVRLAAADSA